MQLELLNSKLQSEQSLAKFSSFLLFAVEGVRVSQGWERGRGGEVCWSVDALGCMCCRLKVNLSVQQGACVGKIYVAEGLSVGSQLKCAQ